MKIKTTIILFALFMALQYVASAQTNSDAPKTIQKEQTVQKVKPVDASATKVPVNQMKSVDTKTVKAEPKADGTGPKADGTGPKKDGTGPNCSGVEKKQGDCSHGDKNHNCAGHKDGNKDCCKDKAKSAEGCQHKHGDAKSEGCKGQTKATGDLGENRSSKGCCHR